MKKKIIIITTLLICLCLIMFSLYKVLNKPKHYEELNGLPVYYTSISYALDTSTPEKTAGASKYITLVKVNKILRTEYINPLKKSIKLEYDPVTIYSATVIENIKGNLVTSEDIELAQYGGISKDLKSYVFPNDTSFLKTGEYYLLMTGASENGGPLSVTDSNRVISFGNDLNYINNIKENKIKEEDNNLYIKIKKYLEAINNESKPNKNDKFLENLSKYDINYK